MILGGVPNRIGHGIEFDYCCVHASFALRDVGYETVMLNSNPETVSTDYDTSDKLFFEPLTLEDVLEIYNQEGCSGAIVQFGGQTPLSHTTGGKGVNIIGTSPEMIDAAEDRDQFRTILENLNLKQPENRIAHEMKHTKQLKQSLPGPVETFLRFRGSRNVHRLQFDEMRAIITDVFDAHPANQS